MANLVVNKRKHKYDIYIGRGSKWGNPYELKDYAYDRNLVISLYSDYLYNNKYLLSCLGELTGKILGCYCYPFKCHGDILVRMANNPITVKVYARYK